MLNTYKSGTTLFSIIKDDCLVIGADSFAGRKDGKNETMTKLAVVRNAVIACEGMGEFRSNKKVFYRADKWMTQIEASLPVEINAAILADQIAKTHPFIKLFKSEKTARGLVEFERTKGYLADFLIASASIERLMLIRLRAEISPIQNAVEFNRMTYFDGSAPVSPFVRNGAGRMGEIDQAFTGNGNTYQQMLVCTNGSFKRLIEGNEVTPNELCEIVRCAISLEGKAEHKSVGPPFVVAALQPGKTISVTSYSE